jgi:hypothetical protein
LTAKKKALMMEARRCVARRVAVYNKRTHSEYMIGWDVNMREKKDVSIVRSSNLCAIFEVSNIERTALKMRR